MNELYHVITPSSLRYGWHQL